MSLVINNNLMAANTARNLNTHYGRLAISTQRLSSGLRINGAADDAAGLAIRELMRADVAALNQGVRNANDAISMIQVVDGALGIIDEKLIRMKELAEQAATGTYDSTQRLMIDSEFQAMASEIDRIANATDFNGIKLIAGEQLKKIKLNNPEIKSIGTTITQARKYYEQRYQGVVGDLGFTVTNAVVDEEKIIQSNGTKEIDYIEIDGQIYKKTINNINITTKISHKLYTIGSYGLLFTPRLPYDADESQKYEILTPNLFDMLPKITSPAGGSFTIKDNMLINFTYSYADNDTLTELNAGYFSQELSDKHHRYRFEFDINGDNIGDIASNILLKDYIDHDTIKNSFEEFHFLYNIYPNHPQFSNIDTQLDNGIFLEKVSPAEIGDTIKIHFGPLNDSAEDYYYIDKRDCTLKGLGLEDTHIETQDNAQKALVTINDAIVKKDQARAYYGAMQNRLENTVSNLTIQAENLQASGSRISDVDVATEMTNFIRNQILMQSAVAMLSQANTLPQMAMQLIGG